ncbi:folylpolyglutamate synthase [Aspergillus campestris IBT 28561]|uniref:Folylpolyglutamate synthase n=1 Tax=Aspergillus campestris (strain IBT 28561) TaxID=1392248 RepID=A0A2I1CX14_ASPC2|nr:folylpolyglutamate synthase [Aspergillus campestris IBT 28561]PKY02155.1 folylpolyglutamate synthase [Aspergillus campestris IBT 28561]
MKRSYENALRLLDTRRRKARPKVPALLDAPTPSINQNVRGVPSLVGMREWLQALGHSDSDVNNLNIVHVAGTKGKGSTCAFTRSFLREHGLRTGFPKKIGLYTSPDLQCIRERIQIDGSPITEELFTRYFYEVWERLLQTEPGKAAENTRQPRYLQFLALLAFHTFIRENVEAAVFETHHGGEYDVTNVIQKPVVTAITSLGMDHIDQLGPTIENIAWHKAGIFKPGSPAFSVLQDDGCAEVISSRAAEKKTNLTFVPVDNSLPADEKALSAPVQRLNCSLALQLARTFLQLKAPGHTLDTSDISRGIKNFSWIGRFEIIDHGKTQWFLDGAHNPLSLEQAAAWFSNSLSASSTQKPIVLIFSHFSENRDGVTLMECLARALFANNAKPEYVIFTTYQERQDGSTRIDKTLKSPETPYPDLCAIYTSLWKEMDAEATVSVEPSIEGAIKVAESIGSEKGGAHVFVTGSLHLVGGALNLLRPHV